MKKFTFGVLTYNQENYILQTLESIKFQKVNYGAEIAVSLIITDDASKDQTVPTIKKWLERNRQYFAQIDLIANEKNKGTVANFRTILNKVENQGLKVIAGDDLISSRNLFAEYDDLNDKKLKTYFRIELCDGKIYYREKYLIEFYYHKLQEKNREYNLKNFRRGRYLHTPSTLYTKQLFVNAECEKNLEGYKLFEDDPMWYSMIKNMKELEIDFMDCFLQRCKVLGDRLIHEIITVSEIQNLFLQTRLQQTVHNLECRIGLTRTGCHDKQNAILPLGNRFYRPVNRIPLIISGRVSSLAGIVRLVDRLDFGRS